MSMATLKGYDGILVEKIHKLMEHLVTKAESGEVIDISEWMSFFGYGCCSMSAASVLLTSGVKDLILWEEWCMFSSQQTPAAEQALTSYCFVTRFDHEFGMMKDGKDTHGFWRKIDAGLMFVSHPDHL